MYVHKYTAELYCQNVVQILSHAKKNQADQNEEHKFFTQVYSLAHPKTHNTLSTEPPLLASDMHHFADFKIWSCELCL